MNYITYYDNYKDKVYSYFFYNLGGNSQQAEDLTSDTFLKAFKNFSSFDDNYQFSTWIFTIARNTLYDFYKKNKKDVQIDEFSESSYSEFLSYHPNIIDELDATEKIDDFLLALESLKPEHKAIIIMKYVDDYSYKEIAEKYKKSEENVRQIISRGMKKTKKILSNTNNYEQ